VVPREYFGDALAWVGRIGFQGTFEGTWARRDS